MVVLPSGTVTFLFTDIEGSTRSWEDDPVAMRTALELHDAIVRGAVGDHDGYVFSTAGDAFGAAFGRAGDAIAAARAAQVALAAESWSDGVAVKVRMGIHTGEAQEREGDYFGQVLNRAARIMSAGHGGQVLVSAATAALVAGEVFIDLGQHRLKDLAAPLGLFQLGDDSFPAIATLSADTGGLPVQRTELVGRADLVDSTNVLLMDEKLVSLVGVGGIGKTRLAVQVAASVAREFPDGVWFCDLAPVRDAGAVPNAVADVLGVLPHPATSLVDSIVAFCRGRWLLIVLDNCEHVIDEVADLVARLRRSAPDVAVLATSREPLRVSGERVLGVPPLDVGDRTSSAVQLFVARAAAVQPMRSWAESEMAIIERVCRRLDGLPLAIELAASRTRSMTVMDLESRLDPAFRVLRGGARDVERHRTLQAAIDWSYEMLDDGERLLFDRLAVFAGGCSVEAAEAVCAGSGLDSTLILGLLDELVNQSLLVADTSREHTRYRLYEPIRQYAEYRLGSRGDLEDRRDRHLAFFDEWMEDWNTSCWGNEIAWRRAVAEEWANLRTAFNWACDRKDLDRASRIVVSAAWTMHALGRTEVGDWGARVLELDGIDRHPRGPHVAALTSSAYYWRGDDTRARQASAFGERMDSEFGTGIHAHMLWLRGDRKRAARIQSVRAESNNPSERVTALWQLGLYAALGRSPEDLAAATRHVDELRNDPITSGSELVASMADQVESVVELSQANFAASASLARSAIAAARHVESSYFAHMALPMLGAATAGAGDVRSTDLTELARGLREQRDARQVTDQWLTLIGAMWALSVFDRSELVREIHLGLATSPWADHPGVRAAKQMVAQTETRPESAPTIRLEPLVSRVLVELDAIGAELTVG